MLIFTLALEKLLVTDDMIAIGRTANPASQRLQFLLDCKQAEVEAMRARIEIAMLGIAVRN